MAKNAHATRLLAKLYVMIHMVNINKKLFLSKRFRGLWKIPGVNIVGQNGKIGWWCWHPGHTNYNDWKKLAHDNVNHYVCITAFENVAQLFCRTAEQVKDQQRTPILYDRMKAVSAPN